MIGTKETCKFQVHHYRLLGEITSKNDDSGLVIDAVLCSIVKANGTRVNVVILQNTA
jgi:hypothetical protein